ncbi:putative xanthine dehydrogenase YagT iron-sulfur-binding subunit [Streptomyces sp. Tu6071]|nr:putative xanthine dehydrogenase YagT iron-sulfur-binding subunit [Streptomyces sp. Tu6071]
MRVGAAAAQVAAEPFADLGVVERYGSGRASGRGDERGVSGLGLGEEAEGGAELSGGAVAALVGVVGEERLLERVEPFPVREALDGGDLGVLARDGEDEAAVDAASADEHGARAALAVVAALLGAGEAEVFAQQVDERGAVVEGGNVVHGAVDTEGEVRVVGALGAEAGLGGGVLRLGHGLPFLGRRSGGRPAGRHGLGRPAPGHGVVRASWRGVKTAVVRARGPAGHGRERVPSPDCHT